jgi:hypothetical protein
MSKLGVYFNDAGEMDYPFTDPLYLQAHQRFAKEMAKDAIEVVVVRGENSHLGDTSFSHYWTYTETGVERHDKRITVDLIYNKSVLPIPDAFPAERTFNHPELDKLCHDKMATFDVFGQLMPKSLDITSENWREVISQLETNQITLKPLEGEGGAGIHFVDRSTFDGSQFNFTEG